MADLVGSIHQFLNNCKDTIVSWCKDAAKTVCLPLTGGTVNGNVSTKKLTATSVNSSGDVYSKHISIDNPSTTGAIVIINTTTSYNDIYATSENNDDEDKRIGFIRFNPNRDGYKEIEMVVPQMINNSLKYSTIRTGMNSSGEFYTKAMTPTSVTDNTNNIATTYWVNQALANMTKGYNTSNGTRYIKFPNGLMICAGYAANVTAGSVVNFPAAFKNMPDVVIVRHWGGTGDSTVGASSTVGSAPVQVYNTTVSSFRVGVHTATAADSSAYINGSYTIYAMWIAVGEWK